MSVDLKWLERRLDDGDDLDALLAHGLYNQAELKSGLDALSSDLVTPDSGVRKVFYWPILQLVPGVPVSVKECGAWLKDPRNRAWGSATKIAALAAKGWKPREYSTASFRDGKLSVTVGVGWQDDQKKRARVLAVALIAYIKGSGKSPFRAKRKALAKRIGSQPPRTWLLIEEWLENELMGRIK
tara:strand:- start:3891 stop:4442 length:552 start_codon:yes stop_codon:yes gene_type:complete